MEAERHRQWRTRRRNRALLLNWLGIAISWSAILYVLVLIQEQRSLGQLEACRRAPVVSLDVRCDASTASASGFEGALGLQALLTTILLVSIGIVTTRKHLRDPLNLDLLTRSRPGGRSTDLGTRDDAGSWKRPQADRGPNREEGRDALGGGPTSLQTRHLGIRRFRVPKTYRDREVGHPRAKPADGKRDPSTPPAA